MSSADFAFSSATLFLVGVHRLVLYKTQCRVDKVEAKLRTRARDAEKRCDDLEKRVLELEMRAGVPFR